MRRYTSRFIFRIDENCLSVLKKNVEERNKKFNIKITESEYIRNLILQDNYESATASIDKSACVGMLDDLNIMSEEINNIAHKINMGINDKADIKIIIKHNERLCLMTKMLEKLTDAVRNYK